MTGLTFDHDQTLGTSSPGEHGHPRAQSDEQRMHLALFYAGEQEYVEGVLNFTAPAIESGEPVAVAVPGAKAELLRRSLRTLGAEAEIFDMVELGRNPARIIPAVEGMLARHEGSLLHYVGEPVWPGRSPEEIREATRHEALINVAWPGAKIRMLCPYDTAALGPSILKDARRTHPYLIMGGETVRSPRYRGPAVPRASDGPLPDPPPHAATLPFELQDLSSVRALVNARATLAGLSPDAVSDLVLAVNELSTNTIRHGGGRGVLHMWSTPGSVVCQVDDTGHIADPLAGRRVPKANVPGGVGLWAVNQLCDLVEMRSSPAGTVVRVHFPVR